MADIQCCGDPGWTVAVKVQLLGLVAQLVVLVVTIFAAFHGIRKQLRLLTFNEYTRRYTEAMADMPSEARRPAVPQQIDMLDEKTREKVVTAMRRYFNMCSEELHLFRQGNIDKKTWGIWCDGMRNASEAPYFASCWAYLRTEYGGFQAFCEFMDRIAKRET